MESTATSCHIEFRDNGPGIPPAILARLFEPFVTNKERGTGLGLAISRRIVQQHDGRLIASNHHTAGAIFRVELPLSRDS